MTWGEPPGGAEDQVEARAAGSIRWLELGGRGIVVRAPAGSFAAISAESRLHELERIRAALERVLKPPTARVGESIDVYLVDSSGEGEAPTDGVGATGVVLTFDSELSELQALVALTRFAIGRWFGPAAAGVPLIAGGVAGLVAARTGAGPPVADADEHLRSLLEPAPGAPQQPRPSILAGLEPAVPAPEDVLDPVATSFLSFLFERFGHDRVGRFLAGYDPARRDESANEAFRQPLAALQAAWLEELTASTPARPFRDFFGYLMPLFKPYRRQLAEVGVWMVFGLGATVAAPLLTRHLIDRDLPSGNRLSFALTALGLLVLYLADGAVGLRRTYIQSRINVQVLTDLHARTFAHLQRLSHSFYTEARVGDVMVRLSQDLGLVEEALGQLGANGVFMLLTVFAAIATLIYMSVWLGLLVLLAIPVVIGVYIFIGVRTATVSYERQQETGKVASAAQENLTAHAVVKAYGLEDYATASYRARLAALMKVALRMNLIVAALESSMMVAFRVMTVLVIGVGGYLVMRGSFTLGTLVAFVAVLPSLFSPITILTLTLQFLQMAAGSMRRVTELLDERPEIADRPDAHELERARGEIRFEHVTFGYDSEEPVLHDLSLTIPAGANVAVVGPSGSGKSTVASLLMRFWDPDQGRVLVDGVDAREVTLASLRGQIGLVFQETFVFDTTARENIGIGKLDASDAAIREAAHAARLDAWLGALPAGYDTLLGERGTRMSGGQRQRLAIARALLRDPRILLLDEATSALDAQTEAAILETLAEVAHGRTTIGITHRLSLAATADRIFVLDGGRLVESGTHAELVAAGGLYSRLHEEQTGHVVSGGRRPGLRLDRLRAIPLLSRLDDEGLAAVERRLVLERFAAGEVVVREGESGDRFFLIARGQVHVVLERGGYERRLATIHEGEFFGEMALLDDETRVATVRTAVPTDTYSLARQDLHELMEREPGIRRVLLETLAERRRAHAAAVAAVEPPPLRT